MAYLVYEYSPNETFDEIAHSFGITTFELMRINNIGPPYPSTPSDLPNSSGTLTVPDILTGNESTENGKVYLRRNNIARNEPQRRPQNDLYLGAYSGVGANVQKKCWMRIEGFSGLAGPSGDIIYFPCFPEDYSDSCSPNFSELNPIGRSEPFQIYQNTGAREVSVSFTMHKEMVHVGGLPIKLIVDAVRATAYPLGTDSIVPTVTLCIGNEVEITGVIRSAPGVRWYGPINKFDRYSMVDLNFTVTECTGNPRTAFDVLSGKYNKHPSTVEDWNMV